MNERNFLISKEDIEYLKSLEINIEADDYDKNIFVIGDSHSIFFGGGSDFKTIPIRAVNGVNTTELCFSNIIVFHLGPCLAWKINDYNSSTKAREKVEKLLQLGLIPHSSKIICCFGEIDLRTQVLKQADLNNISFTDVVDGILEKYINFLKFISINNDIYVWGPVPSPKDGAYINPQFPQYGPEVDRNIATKYFNSRLAELSKLNGFKFVSIFDELIDDNLSKKDKYFIGNGDSVHLAKKAWEIAESELMYAGIEVIWKPKQMDNK